MNQYSTYIREPRSYILASALPRDPVLICPTCYTGVPSLDVILVERDRVAGRLGSSACLWNGGGRNAK